MAAWKEKYPGEDLEEKHVDIVEEGNGAKTPGRTGAKKSKAGVGKSHTKASQRKSSVA